MLSSNETDRAYIAGIIDGEGTFCITERSRPPTRCVTPAFTASISVSMVDKDAVKFLSERFRGRLYKFNHRDGRLPYYRFDVAANKEVRELLTAIIPYVRVKSVQATIMMNFVSLPQYKGGWGQYVPDEIINKRRFYSEEIKRVNQRMV